MINENGDEFMWTKRGPNWVLHIRRKTEIERDRKLTNQRDLMTNAQQSYYLGISYYFGMNQQTALHNSNGSLFGSLWGPNGGFNLDGSGRWWPF